MSKKGNRALTRGSLVLLAVLFVASTVLVHLAFRGLRIDFTEHQLYTLSEGTRNILSSIEEPITLYYYFSDQATQGQPQWRAYAQRVREVLEEFVAHADGQLRLHVIDPVAFTDAEDEASQRGLQPFPLPGGTEAIFFGLVGTNSVDGQEIIPIFDPSKEKFLEYDLAKLVYTLNTAQRPVVGLMSTLPIGRGFDPATRQMRQPWMVIDQVEQLFEVRTLAPGATEIDPEIDVLMLVHPKDLGDEALFAIDQFVLGGGRLLLFIDPQAESEQPQNQMDPQAAMFASRASDLNRLLTAWGVEYDPSQVVLDRVFALQVPGPGGQVSRHPGFLGLRGEDGLNLDDVALAQLDTLNFAYAGSLRPVNGATIEFTPLAFSSTDSMLVPTDRVRFVQDPASLLNGFTSAEHGFIVAARIRGQLKSAFPDGLDGDAGEGAQASEDGDADDNTSDDHLTESSSVADVVVVADADMLLDGLWVRVQSFFGQRLASPFANNGDFVINVLDNLVGSSDLISIRGRASAQRPFTRVQALEREAEAQFRATEEQLEQELRETERKLSELQTGRDDGNPLILTAEQRAELDRFQDQRLEIRKRLRDVQNDLRKDKEALGVWLRNINLLLVPLLLIAVALVTWRMRIAKRRAN